MDHLRRWIPPHAKKIVYCGQGEDPYKLFRIQPGCYDMEINMKNPGSCPTILSA
jgi:hypothetical protein